MFFQLKQPLRKKIAKNGGHLRPGNAVDPVAPARFPPGVVGIFLRPVTQGHQFDPRVKMLLAFCSARHPRRFDMLHDHV